MPSAKVAGAAGAGMPPGKVEQVPTKGGGDAGAGANLIGGGAGDLSSVLANLVAALEAVVAALGGPTAPAMPVPMDGASTIAAISSTGRPITIVREGDSYRLGQLTGYLESTVLDGKRIAFGADGRAATLRDPGPFQPHLAGGGLPAWVPQHAPVEVQTSLGKTALIVQNPATGELWTDLRGAAHSAVIGGRTVSFDAEGRRTA